MVYFYSCFVAGNENLRCYGVIEGDKIQNGDDFFKLRNRALEDAIIPKINKHAPYANADDIVFVAFNKL